MRCLFPALCKALAAVAVSFAVHLSKLERDHSQRKEVASSWAGLTLKCFGQRRDMVTHRFRAGSSRTKGEFGFGNRE